MREKMKKFWQIPAAAFLFLVSSGGMAAARTIDGFADWYGAGIYPVLAGIFGRIFGLLSVSAVETGMYVLTVIIVIWGIRHIKKPWLLIKNAVFFVSCLCFLYVVNCGINYSRTPFSAVVGLETKESSKEELYQLCEFLTGQVILASQDNLEMAGQNQSLTFKEAWNMGREGVKAMEKLGTVYPQLGGFYPNPKPVGISWILSVQQLAGVYSPFTIEANFNRAMTPYNIPHTVCHELSHLKGFMREDEANFIGYLACVGSDSADYRYSGYLTGWIYASNALYEESREQYFELYQRLPETAKSNLVANNLFWDKYEGKAAEAASKMNDTYLKLNQQTDGIKSYGRVVDLMLAYYQISL